MFLIKKNKKFKKSFIFVYMAQNNGGYFRFQTDPDQKADSILSSVVLQKDREMMPIGDTSPILPSA